MKKVGSSLKYLGAIFLGIVLLFLLFSMFRGSREGFGSACINGGNCDQNDTTCTANAGQTCSPAANPNATYDKSYTLTCKATGSGSAANRKWYGVPKGTPC
jgi:hypothetical protein